jgi:RHS repeat-associated protein
VTTQVVYSPTGEKFSFMNGQTLKTYVLPMAGGLQVVYNASGLQYFRQADWLGSSRLASNADGSLHYDASYGPWGEPYNETGTTDRSFTGQTQDTTGGIYDFMFRQHSPVQGRWLTPDPAGLAAVDITNPQTWNRYAYVMNNPLSYVDPLGLDCASGNVNNFDNSDLLPGSVTTTGTGACPNENDDRAQPSRVYWGNIGPGLGQGGGRGWNLTLFRNGTCTRTANGGWQCVQNVPGQAGSAPASSGTTAANNGTPPSKNPCVTDALKSGAITLGIDALGFLPEVGGVARVVGHQAGYVGKVADNLGKNMLTAGTKTTGFLSSATGFNSSDWTTWVSAGITAADFVPVLSDFTTPVAMAWDAGVTAYEVYQCPK